MTITDPTTIPTDQREHFAFLADYARHLLDEHGFHDVPFLWDNAVKRWGACHFRRGYAGERTLVKITMSRKLTALNDLNACEDTILHELAHAIAIRDYNHSGHGATWKRIARGLGIAGDRCYNPDEHNTVEARYLGTCPREACDKVYKRERMPRGARSCPCASRGFNPDTVIVWRRNPARR